MGVKEILEGLSSLERKVLPVLKPKIDFKCIINITKLKEIEVMRALQWLENKSLIKLNKTNKDFLELDTNGKRYLEEGMPEKRFLKVLNREMSIKELVEKSDLSKEEINVCIGILRKKAAIFVLPNRNIKVTEKGKVILQKGTLEESLLKSLPKELSSLTPEEKFAFQELKKRKRIVKKATEKIITVDLTEKGEEILKSEINDDYIDTLTPKCIKTGEWKGKKFRRYDVTINVPKIQYGKRHFTNLAVEYVKRIWLDLGFKEMTGNILQTSFWNFDSLFTAQDHPVRDLHDTFFIKSPANGKLPSKELYNRVKKTHESGWTTGSLGWRYKWSEEIAKKVCLRTHTTVLSAQTISRLKDDDLPAKFFSVGKCFRNETLDWSHLFEFYQVEGIVVDPKANFQHLLGYLKNFFKKMGYKDVRIRPGYFPYTEMSAEVDVLHPVRNEWVELGGSGIFRPEVVKPLLGKEVPVLAWGLGFPRIIAEYYKITDIRDLYNNDIKKLRDIKLWLR